MPIGACLFFGTLLLFAFALVREISILRGRFSLTPLLVQLASFSLAAVLLCAST